MLSHQCRWAVSIVDWPTPITRHFPRVHGSAPRKSVTNPTDLHGKTPDGMPTHGSNEVAGNMARAHLEMDLNSQQVIGDGWVDIG